MKKMIFLALILLCCGCRARYELTFNDNTISDNLSVSYPNNGVSNSQIDSIYSNSFYALGRDHLYNYRNNSSNSTILINYSYDYNVSEFDLANIPNNCFTDFNFVNEDNKYYFFVDGMFKCGYYAYEHLDSLDIVISTNHVVIQENADEKKNGKYIWHVNPDNESFSLRFVTSEKIKNNNFKYYLLGFSLLFIIVCIFFVVRKFRFKNEI